MQIPALSRLAVGGIAAAALSLSAAAPSFADDAVATPSASESATATETLPPADPTAPVEAEATSDTDAASPATATATESAAPSEVTEPAASPSATPTAGGNGAYSYPFILTPGEAGAATVAIEVAGTGISVGYTVDELGKVTDAVVAAGAASLVKTTPHTIFLVLETGETVKVKVHGDSVRVKVKPLVGGPLRPGISTPEEVAADEAAEAEAADVEGSDEAKPAKPAKAAKAKKAKKTHKGNKGHRGKKAH